MNLHSASHKSIQLGLIISIVAALVIIGTYGDKRGGNADGAADSISDMGMSGSDACPENPPALIGIWAKNSPVSSQVNIFSACEATVLKSNGCRATFSYEVDGNVLSNKLLEVSPSICGTVGTISKHMYTISANTLTIGSTVFTKQ